MGIFLGPVERRSDKGFNALLDALTGGRRSTGSTAPVTFNSALSLDAVWACVNLRASLLSTFPLDVFRRAAGGTSVEIPKPPVLRAPGGEGMEIEEWLFAGQVALDLRGNNFGIITAFDSLGLPRQIELVHPDTVAIHRARDDGRLLYRIGRKDYERAEIWHEKAFVVPGSPLGLSPIRAAADTVGVAIAARRMGRDWFDSGGRPTALLFNDQPPSNARRDGQGLTESLDVAKKRFAAADMGPADEPVTLAGSWKYERLQVSPADAQLIESMRWSVPAVCRLFGVPPEMIGASSDGQSITYANVEQRGLHFLTYNLGTTIRRRQTALSRLTPSPQFVRFNTGSLLATDLLTRYRAHEIAIRSKFRAQDEVRAIEDAPPLTPEQIAQLQSLGSNSVPPIAVAMEDQ